MNAKLTGWLERQDSRFDRVVTATQVLCLVVSLAYFAGKVFGLDLVTHFL